VESTTWSGVPSLIDDAGYLRAPMGWRLRAARAGAVAQPGGRPSAALSRFAWRVTVLNAGAAVAVIIASRLLSASFFASVHRRRQPGLSCRPAPRTSRASERTPPPFGPPR